MDECQEIAHARGRNQSQWRGERSFAWPFNFRRLVIRYESRGIYLGVDMISCLTKPTPFLFFTGKGGVGKTSSACATALQLARAGKKVLIVSTDPALNLDTVLGTALQPDVR